MKKPIKKIASMILALVMVFALGTTAFAAEEDKYSITVENSIGGVEYTVYKVFDATYDGDAVSYSITEEDPWYELVNASDSPFTLTASPDGSYYVVSTTADSEGIAEWFNALDAEDIPTDSQVGESKEGNGGSITFDLTEAGYYLIVPASESYDSVAVTVDTAAPDVTVVDKNQGPGDGKGPGDPDDPHWEGGFTKDATGDSYSVGDEVTYSIRSYVPTYNGETKITSYEVTDVMGAGLTYEEGTITVEIYGTGLDGYEDITDDCTINAVVDADGITTLTIKWNIEQIEEDDLVYPADAMVRITYTDLVNEAADDTDLTNDVDLIWYRANPDYDPDDPDSPPEIPDNPDAPLTSDETVYIYGFDLKKTDGTNTLEGSQFTLQKQGSSEPITFLYDEESDTYEETTTGSTTTTITVGDGDVNVWGLGEGTYILTETVAPDGYNLLADSVTIVITGVDNGWTVSVTVGDSTTTSVGAFTYTDTETDEHGIAVMPVITIVNAAGSTLPGTGGMGTYLFYIIGAIVICGAAIVLVLRRRNTNAEA